MKRSPSCKAGAALHNASSCPNTYNAVAKASPCSQHLTNFRVQRFNDFNARLRTLPRFAVASQTPRHDQAIRETSLVARSLLGFLAMEASAMHPSHGDWPKWLAAARDASRCILNMSELGSACCCLPSLQPGIYTRSQGGPHAGVWLAAAPGEAALMLAPQATHNALWASLVPAAAPSVHEPPGPRRGPTGAMAVTHGARRAGIQPDALVPPLCRDATLVSPLLGSQSSAPWESTGPC